MGKRHNKKKAPPAGDANFKYGQFSDDVLLDRQDSPSLQPQQADLVHACSGGIFKEPVEASYHEPDILQLYLLEAFREPVLFKGEDVILTKRWRDHGDVAAFRRLLMSHARLVVSLAKKFAGELSLDLIQEGNIALWKAVKNFDPELGVPLYSYAKPKIWGAFQDFTKRNRAIIRFPKKKPTLLDELSFDASRAYWKVLSFDAPIDDGTGDSDGEFTLYDMVSHGVDDPNLPPPPPSPETVAAQHQACDRLLAAVAELPERQRQVIKLRWLGNDKRTLDSVGRKLGVSRETVRKAEKRAFSHLRDRLRWAA